MTALRLRLVALPAIVGATATGAAALVTVAAGPAAALAGTVPTSLSIRAARDVVPAGSRDLIAGDMKAKGRPVRHRRIVLLDKVAGGDWTSDATATTGAKGHVGFTVNPTEDVRYSLAFLGHRQERASHSGVVSVKVRPVGELSIAVATASIQHGATDTVSGTLTDPAGDVVSGDKVVLLDRPHGRKHLHKEAHSTTDSNGDVSFAVTPGRTTSYRLFARPTSGQGETHSERATVHILRGSSISIRELTSSDGTGDAIVGVLYGAGRPLPHRTVTLQSSPSGADEWTDVTTVTSGKHGKLDADGQVPTAPTDYRWSFAGGPGYESSISGTVTAGSAS